MSHIDQFRKEIDSIDSQLHDLLMKRAELVMAIGEVKRKNNVQMIQPDREAAMIRRLMERHQGKLPKAAIVRIWRELISAVSLLQTPMKVAIAVPANNAEEYWDMARNYFGSVIPMQGVVNPLGAISMVREGEANFAVVPWPEDEAENPWWSYLSSEDPEQNLKIMVRLPYGDRVGGQGNPEFRALVIARLNFNSSGHDRSFLMLDLDHSVSRARIVDKAKMLGLKAVSIYSRRLRDSQERTAHLVEVEDYVAAQDVKLQQLLDKLENPDGLCIALGGYPILPLLADETSARKKKTA